MTYALSEPYLEEAYRLRKEAKIEEERIQSMQQTIKSKTERATKLEIYVERVKKIPGKRCLVGILGLRGLNVPEYEDRDLRNPFVVGYINSRRLPYVTLEDDVKIDLRGCAYFSLDKGLFHSTKENKEFYFRIGAEIFLDKEIDDILKKYGEFDRKKVEKTLK